jgi:hypothetical protein
MKNYVIVILSAVIIAVVTTVILINVGLENAAGIGGGVAGAGAGVMASTLLKKKE